MKQSRLKRLRLPFISAIVVSILIATAGYSYWVFVDHRFWTVTGDQVYRSGAMPVETLKNKIKKYGIKTVIDFRKTPNEVDKEHRALTRMGVKHFNLPSDQVPSDETVTSFLAIMDNQENRPVLLHCNHGKGRAVLFSAIYRIEFEGWSNEDARRASRLILYNSGFSSDSRKGKFVLDYVPRFRLAD